MYENATTCQIRTGTLDEALATLRSEIVPLILAQNGLINLALVPNHTDCTLTVISFWQSPSHAQAVESVKSYRHAIVRLGSLLEGTPAFSRRVLKNLS